MVGVGGVCWREFVVGGGFVGVCLDVQRSSGLSGGTSNKEEYHWLAFRFQLYYSG